MELRGDNCENSGELVTNDHRDNLFLGIWEEIWGTQNTKKPHFTRKIYDIVLFYPNLFPKKMFLGTIWEQFGNDLGNAERMVFMRKKNYKGRCERRTIEKAEGVCRFYSKIQLVYADKLVENEQVVEIYCNVLLEELSIGEYTTDFFCKKNDGTYMVRECVQRKQITWPSVTKLLDASLHYWRKRGIEDWGIVVDKEVPDHEEK